MRFIPSSCLKPGMITARDLYGNDNELLLSKGQALTETEIYRFRLMQFQGIYILDDISEGIEAKSVISSSLRNKTVKAFKDISMQIAESNLTVDDTKVSSIKALVDSIVDEVILSRDTVINLIDIKSFNDYTYYHSVNVAVISLVLGVSLGLTRTELYRLGLGSLLHDIGKVFVPENILNKQAKLDEDEFENIKQHTYIGSKYLREKWDIPYEANSAVLNHHEKYDGTGYPYSLKRDKIPIFGRIVAIADVYDALISDRPYRRAFSPSEAMEYMMGGSGTLFDPKLVECFVRRVLPYPAGTCVELSDKSRGIVVENYLNCCMRPKIRIISADNIKGDETYYDLYNDKSLLNVTITGIAKI